MKEKRIHTALDAAKGRIEANGHVVPVDIDNLSLIIFSDHHRGQGDGADDFQKSKAAYHAALAYYREKGYQLCLLGDVEELWECRPASVLKHYSGTLDEERPFCLGSQFRWTRLG